MSSTIDASIKDQAALIDALGGPKPVARIIHDRCGRQLIGGREVSFMKLRGIPWKYRPALAAAAAEAGVEVPKGFLGFADEDAA